MSNLHTKFGWISLQGLGGNSIKDRQVDRGDYNIPFAFLKKHGDIICVSREDMPDALAVCRAHRGLPVWISFAPVVQFNLLLSPYPCFVSLLYLDLYVLGDDALIS